MTFEVQSQKTLHHYCNRHILVVMSVTASLASEALLPSIFAPFSDLNKKIKPLLSAEKEHCLE